MSPTRGRRPAGQFGGFPPPSRPRPVEGGLAARSVRGEIGERWWSRRFIAVLESFALGSRLTRGKNYARRGQVISLDVTPGAVSRERMARLLERLPRDATHVIWEPRGVWEADDAAVAAKKWGVVLGNDPARDNVPDGPVSYGRLRSLGETRSFGASALQRIVDKIGIRRDAYLVIETSSALTECKELRRLSQSSKRSGGAKAGMVVKPRGGSKTIKPANVLKVRDDEQE